MYWSYSNIIDSFIVLGCGVTTYNKDFDDDDDDASRFFDRRTCCQLSSTTSQVYDTDRPP